MAQSEPEPPASQTSAEQLVRKVVGNELKADKDDQSLWMFDTNIKNSDGDIRREVVQTRQGMLYLTVSNNGKPLTSDQAHKERTRIQKAASDADEPRKLEEEQSHDSGQAEKILSLVPKALFFAYGQRHDNMVEITFRPNPNFRPDSHEGQVLAAMAGTIWVNTKEDRLAQIDGHLEREVKFGGGLLGHLDKGGAFHVTQLEVQPGHWEMSALRVNMQGKILFFKSISEQQNQTFTNYHRMPDSLTLAQGADLLISHLQSLKAPKEAESGH